MIEDMQIINVIKPLFDNSYQIETYNDIIFHKLSAGNYPV